MPGASPSAQAGATRGSTGYRVEVKRARFGTWQARFESLYPDEREDPGLTPGTDKTHRAGVAQRQSDLYQQSPGARTAPEAPSCKRD